ncbi:MAG: M14 family metallopeptidase [Proteobacteria bacterium]|nr:M14 family metallopeptidase [Pseudomonadota bacterium]
MLAKFAFIFRLLVLATVLAPNAFALQFQRYHRQDEIGGYLRAQAQEHPDMVRFVTLGRSLQGREIAYLAVSRNWSPDAPAIYFNGTHHGNEKASTEAVLGLIDFLVLMRDRSDVDQLLRRYRIILQPLVNPDGHAANVRTDSQGIDPNRDYATPTRLESEAFRLVETRLVRRLLENERIVASAAFHSGLEAVLWPWAHTPSLSQHDVAFRTLGESVARSMGVVKYSQSFNDYQADGEFIDYAYMKFGIYAITMEVAQEATPPSDRLEQLVQRAVTGSLVFLKAMDRIHFS